MFLEVEDKILNLFLNFSVNPAAGSGEPSSRDDKKWTTPPIRRIDAATVTRRGQIGRRPGGLAKAVGAGVGEGRVAVSRRLGAMVSE